MSKRINVNPDHYKTAGRERPGKVEAQRPVPVPARKTKTKERRPTIKKK